MPSADKYTIDPEINIINKLFFLCRENINEIDYRFFLLWSFGNKLIAKLITGILQDKGIITVVQTETEEYKKCLETAKKDKRIKNRQKYCRKQHPGEITVKIDCDRLVSIREFYNQNELHYHYPFAYFLFYLID